MTQPFPEIAPYACVVCGTPAPVKRPEHGTWVYLAGSVPLGALACSSTCAATAVDNQRRTGRCDGQVRS